MDIAIGQIGTTVFETDDNHSATRYGNDGVDVIATPALVGLIEVACHRLIEPHFDAGEASVGVHLDLAHEAAAPIGVQVHVSAEIVGIEGRKVTFTVLAQASGTVLMRGQHMRSLVDYDRLRRGLAKRFPVIQ